MSKIYLPTAIADDWKRFLADPEKQWRSGFSAKTLAHSWQSSDGLPAEIASMLRVIGGPVKPLLAIPEYKVALPGSSRGDSQNDVFALARAGDKTVAIMIEGKVKEPFGETMGKWLHEASDGKRERLKYLYEVLGITQAVPEDVHYQLLHRTASAVLEARRFKTDAAAMIVHSFSAEKMWFDAFQKFASLFRVTVKPNELVLARPTGPPLYIGWACGDCSFLAA